MTQRWNLNQDQSSAASVAVAVWATCTLRAAQRLQTCDHCRWTAAAISLVSSSVIETSAVTETSWSRPIVTIASVLFLFVLLPAHSQIPTPSETPSPRNPRMLDAYRTPASHNDCYRKPNSHQHDRRVGTTPRAPSHRRQRHLGTTLQARPHQRCDRPCARTILQARPQRRDLRTSTASQAQLRRRDRRVGTTRQVPLRRRHRRVGRTPQASSHRRRRRVGKTPRA